MRSLEKAWSKITIDFFLKSLFHLFWNFKKHQEKAQIFLMLLMMESSVKGWEIPQTCLLLLGARSPHPRFLAKNARRISWCLRSNCSLEKGARVLLLNSGMTSILLVFCEPCNISVSPTGAQLNSTNTHWRLVNQAWHSTPKEAGTHGYMSLAMYGSGRVREASHFPERKRSLSPS